MTRPPARKGGPRGPDRSPAAPAPSRARFGERPAARPERARFGERAAVDPERARFGERRIADTERKPPPQRRAFSVMQGPVEPAGAPVEARALAALFTVDPALERALTHGFHSYAGRLHPSIARGAIARFAKPGGVVLDPFCGSGTVLAEAQATGRRALGLDASPLAVLIARVRTRTLGEAGRAALVAAAAEVAEASGELARKRRRPEVPGWAQAEFKLFFPHVAFELLGLRALVMETPEDEIGEALRMCFSSLLVKFMRVGPEAPRDGSDKRIARGVPSRFLRDRAEELARGLAALERAMPAGAPAAQVAPGDARAYPHIGAASVDLVLTSPPYAGVYDYAEQHAVRFRWLGLREATFREKQIGEREQGIGAAVSAWREGRRRWLGEMGRVLRLGGHAVLVVGDGVVGDRAEDAAAAVIADAEPTGLRYVAHASQARLTRDRRLLAVFGDRPRREHIVLLRRG